MKNLDLKPLFILLPAALGMALLAGCPAKNNPSSPQNQSAPANTPTNVITSTPTMTSTPCMVAGTPCTSSPTATPTNTATITPTPTVTNTQTATSTPTNSLSAFVTLGSSAFFNNPAGIAYSNGNLWVMDYTNFNLQEWATSGSAPVTTVSSFATTAFSMPWAVGVDPMTGNVYVADGNYGNLANMQSEVFDPSGNFLYAFGNTELGGSTNSDPTGVGVNAAGTTVYIAGESRDTVYVYSISGTSPNQTYTYQFAFGASGIAPQVIDNPYNIHVDGSDNVWVACYGDSSIKEYSAAGIFENNFTAPELVNVQDVVAANGKVYGLNGSGLVVIFNSTGSVIGQFGAGTLNSPQGITTDGAGNFYVTDSANQCVFGFH